MKKQLTVLQILPALNRGGVERGTVQIDNALVAAGHTSIVVSRGGQLVSELKGTHIELPVHTKNPIKMLFNAHLLKFVIKENNVDIVHARSRAPAWSAYLATKGTKAKYITTFHGTYNIQNGFKRWYNSVMTKGVKIIAVSDFIKNHIIDNYGIDAKKIQTIHRGIDIDKFDPETKPAKMGLPKGKKVVLLPGRITRWKGQAVFAEAMRGLDAIGLIVGDSESQNYMRELEEMLPDNVIIMPPTPNLAEVYAASDIVVTASIEPEAFGRVSVEGQAMGKPVVATAHGGSMENVVDGKTGVLVAPDNVESMRDGIAKLLESKKKWKADCIKNARNFSAEKMIEATLKVYKSL